MKEPNESNKIIRAALKENKMSITELAKRLNQTQANVSKKLKQNNIKEGDLRKIAGVLNKKVVIKLEDNE